MKIVTAFFSQILEMSLTAAIVIPAVLVIRSLIGKLPKKYSYYLWAVVLFRLICPVSFSSAFSIFNLCGDKLKQILGRTGVTVPEVSVFLEENMTVAVHKYAEKDVVYEYVPSSADFIPIETSTPMWLQIASILWVIGIAVILFYSIYTYCKFHKTVEKATLLQENIYECENIPSPFVMGIVTPKIYIPYHLDKKEQEYVLAHERYHIKRCDHIIKAVAFGVLTVYWFHPFVWAAFFLACRDMEMSCDEKVLSCLGGEIKQDYSMLLLSFAANRRMSFAGPLAFGESDIGKRVKNVLHFHKPRLWGSVLGVVLLMTAVLGCATDGAENEAASEIEMELDAEKNAGSKAIESDTNHSETEITVQEELAFIQNWAIAFCNRDGKAIYEMASEESYEMLADTLLLEEHNGEFSFGWSSPWPMDADTDWKIDSIGEGKAVILYYAWTSDPHITVWRSEVSYEKEGDKFQCTPEELEILDAIESAEEFFKAYPQGVFSNTQMDYLANGMGEALNENAKANRGTMPAYEELFSPDTAAKNLLNLSDNVEVQELTSEKSDSGEIAYVSALFPDGFTLVVEMKHAFGEDGIWIP